MAYFIAVYDVDKKRVGKFLKLFRRYLTWVQNSVFEGELTAAQKARLEYEINQLIDAQDYVILYEMRTRAYSNRQVIGTEKSTTSNLL